MAWAKASVAALAMICAASCQAFVSSDVAGGIGAPCNKETDCQGSKCELGVCTLPCNGPDVCPEGTFCTSAKKCELPLRAGFVFPGDPNEEQWTRAHEQGRAEAATLSYLIEARSWIDRPNPADARTAIDEAVAAGMNVVFVASSTLGPATAEKAAQYPDVRFYTAGGRLSSENHGSYYGRIYEPWYLAGKAAATKSTSKRLGMIASYVTPAVIRNVNAFTLGARSEDAGAVVQIKWLEFWHDVTPTGTDDERNFAEQLVADGCDVIAHQADNGFAVAYVTDEATTALSIGHNVADACKDQQRCFATVYWNWGPLYRRILDGIHLGEPQNFFFDDMLGQPTQSIPNFATSDQALATALQPAVDALVQAGGVGPAFAGTFCSTETPTPRCFDDMVLVSEDDLNNMCWFVEGVVDGKDAMMMDIPAQVPPEGDCTPAPQM